MFRITSKLWLIQNSTNKQQVISNLHWILVNLILQSGRSISRWQRCNNICIPKKKDNSAVDQFRNIHNYECDLNAALVIKWKEAISKSEENGILCESQLGSRKSPKYESSISIPHNCSSIHFAHKRIFEYPSSCRNIRPMDWVMEWSSFSCIPNFCIMYYVHVYTLLQSMLTPFFMRSFVLRMW